jgi:lipoprotein-anchoring transpeptidase ErfK/SrfK
MDTNRSKIQLVESGGQKIDRRSFLRYAGTAFLSLGLTIAREAVSPKSAEAKKFSYPTPEQEQAVEDLKVEARSDVTVFQKLLLKVDLSEQVVYLIRDYQEGGSEGSIVAKYPCSTGKSSSSTPKGKYAIISAEELDKPQSNGYVTKAWVPFIEKIDKKGNIQQIGFHGSPEYAVTGNIESGGCIRMIEKDVINLFELFRTGVKVHVVG